eukprot:GEZU01015706.1.p1 GENE.GEZU01015706.1~~GEZU01015706.1.p1  ORF type:complete len:220 (+),score=41.53 GEZU01015706.1:69-662(+)
MLHVPIYNFIRDWATAQNTTFYQQLMGGIRYLDLRACWIDTLNEWRTQHFIVGVPTQTLLDDIRRFLDEQQGEVLVVQVGNLAGSNLEQQMQLAQMINETLGPYLYWPKNPFFPEIDLTVGEMVATGQRCLVVYPLLNRNCTKVIESNKFLWPLDFTMEGKPTYTYTHSSIIITNTSNDTDDVVEGDHAHAHLHFLI